MSEEKDTAQAAREMEEAGELAGLPPLKPQLQPSAGVGERPAVARRRQRVEGMLHTLPSAAQRAIRNSYADDPLPWQPYGNPGPDPATGPIAVQNRPSPTARRSAAEDVAGYPPPAPGYGREADTFDAYDPGYGGGGESGGSGSNPSARPDTPPPPSGPGRHRPQP
jgi:phospholipid/cholesterol/gamma-HCH transport system ATP-binding protein